jgi:hypothetical protein
MILEGKEPSQILKLPPLFGSKIALSLIVGPVKMEREGNGRENG